MTPNHEDLREAAEKATPGPWCELHNMAGPMGVLSVSPDFAVPARVCWLDMNGREHANARFIALANPARISALLAEHDDALDRIEELESDAQTVSTEFEGDCWRAVRSLIERTDPTFDFNRDGDGTTAQDACDFLWEAMEGCEQRAVAAEAENAKLLAELDAVKGALKRIAKDHDVSEVFPHGHVYTAGCDACHRQQIALAALSPKDPNDE